MTKYNNLWLFTLVFSFALQGSVLEVDESASIKNTTTTIVGINHIGLSVKNLDQVLKFYQRATGFEIVKQEVITFNDTADMLYATNNVELRKATLKAPNMLFELTQFSGNEDIPLERKPVIGPGMTHTCFQSPITDPAFTKFVHAGAQVLTKSNAPVDIGGYGVTYAYAYDPEGNMFEIEQLDKTILTRSGYDASWQDAGKKMWMSQVALATHDIERLMQFYQKVLGFKPYRMGTYSNSSKLDDIVNIDGVSLKGGWFKLGKRSKVMELWQFVNPQTPSTTYKRKPTDLGYTYSLEVTDIQAEYKRLTNLGVYFFSKPLPLGEFWHAYARDIDGNVFSLRQPLNPESSYALASIED
ncbi:VOC family protein [Aliiglaciecola sp. M165]|uniref:VOC family protein n=1 Tax=Aliiglaciecola sp. M165 TaxID=2593649 RepID=UPI00117C3B2A|nr:VOC family protein [Aliiglaciecola sp. M165]TRY33787.1 hypothetical protein FM019_00565 [Aliiglaciecola sp. M165]